MPIGVEVIGRLAVTTVAEEVSEGEIGVIPQEVLAPLITTNVAMIMIRYAQMRSISDTEILH
jgi:hypothetical protein